MKLKIEGIVVIFLGLTGLTALAVDRVCPPRSRPSADPAACCTPWASAAPAAYDPEDVQRGVVDPSVQVENYKKAQDGDEESETEPGYTSNGIGSGTCIRVRGELLILTAGHVVKGADLVRIKKTFGVRVGLDGISQRATVVAFSDPDSGLDLSLVKPADGYGEGLTPAAVLDTPTVLHLGEAVWYCGSGGGIENNLERSILNRLNFLMPGEPVPYLVVNGNGWHGHSGSGVFVKRGGRFQLAGVVLAGLRTYPKTPVFCRQPQEVRDFLAAYGAKASGGCEGEEVASGRVPQ